MHSKNYVGYVPIRVHQKIPCTICGKVMNEGYL